MFLVSSYYLEMTTEKQKVLLKLENKNGALQGVFFFLTLHFHAQDSVTAAMESFLGGFLYTKKSPLSPLSLTVTTIFST